MFGSSQRGANAYAKVGLETGVVAASPHKLIVMLFDGALAAVRSAAIHMTARDIEKKGLATPAEKYIELGGATSSSSGKPYQMQCAGAAPVNSATWLETELKKYRTSSGK